MLLWRQQIHLYNIYYAKESIGYTLSYIYIYIVTFTFLLLYSLPFLYWLVFGCIFAPTTGTPIAYFLPPRSYFHISSGVIFQRVFCLKASEGFEVLYRTLHNRHCCFHSPAVFLGISNRWHKKTMCRFDCSEKEGDRRVFPYFSFRLSSSFVVFSDMKPHAKHEEWLGWNNKLGQMRTYLDCINTSNIVIRTWE